MHAVLCFLLGRQAGWTKSSCIEALLQAFPRHAGGNFKSYTAEGFWSCWPAQCKPHICSAHHVDTGVLATRHGRFSCLIACSMSSLLISYFSLNNAKLRHAHLCCMGISVFKSSVTDPESIDKCILGQHQPCFVVSKCTCALSPELMALC